MINRLLHFAARKSWRCYQTLNFVVDSRGFRIPVSAGVGLELVDGSLKVESVIRAVYGFRQGTFVDIGANVGRALLAVASIDRSIPYLGFEPQLRAARYVQQLIRANQLQATHTIVPVALSDDTGLVTLLSDGETDVSATLNAEVRPPSMYSGRMTVCVCRGDDLLRDVDRIALIKIDAEGAEPRILEGLEQTIARHRPPILIEVLPYAHLENNSYDRSYFGELPEAERLRLVANRKQAGQTIAGIVERAGYRVFRVDGDGLRPASFTESTMAEPDFLLVSQEEAARLGHAQAAEASP
jgi:FkbM family methyltransferase